MTKLTNLFLLSALLSVSTLAASAVTEVDQASGTTGNNSDAFAGDIAPNLLQGLLPTGDPAANSDVGGFDNYHATDGASNAAFLDNGAFGGNQLPGAFYIYDLNLANAPLGFTLSKIQLIAGGLNVGDQSFADQAYTVSYSTVAASSVFIPLATVDYDPFAASPNSGSNSTSTEVTLTDLTGAVGVADLKFTFAVANSSGNPQDGFLQSEIQAFGVATVPEPATYAMVLSGLVLIGVSMRRKLV